MSPVGTDREVDILPGKGPLGFDPPKLLVQIQDGAGLAFLCAVPEALRAEEQAKLERHIKAWQTV